MYDPNIAIVILFASFARHGAHPHADRLVPGAFRHRHGLLHAAAAGRPGPADEDRNPVHGAADHPAVHRGRRDHERRRHLPAPGDPRQRPGGPAPRRARPGGRGVLHVLRRRHRLLRGRRVGDRLHHDPHDEEARLRYRLFGGHHHRRRGAGRAGAAQPQHDPVFHRRRHHRRGRLGGRAVPGRHRARACSWASPS